MHLKNLNFFFKKFRININYFFNYNKIIAKLYRNNKIKNPENYKDENYFLKISEDKSYSLKSIKEQMGNKIRISKEKDKDKDKDKEKKSELEEEKELKITSFENCIKPKRIDYLINNNQSKIILDYENDEIKLDKEINSCKKLIFDTKYTKLRRLLMINSTFKLKYFFNNWKNLTEYPENHYYDNILEYFECVKNENVEIEYNKNKVKNDYKKLIQDYKTLKNFFCEDCIICKNTDDENNNIEEEFNLDMKSINSEFSNSNLNPSDLRADSNYNSEIIINRKFRSKIFYFYFYFYLSH